MVSIRILWLAIAIMTLAAQPVLAGNEKAQSQLVCPDGTAPSTGNQCTAAKPSTKYKNSPPTATPSALPKPSGRTEPVTAEDRAIASDIVRLYLPYDAYLESLNSFLAVKPEAFMAQNPQMQALERTYPGIIPLLMRRIGEMLIADAPKSYAKSVEVQSEVFAHDMSRDELIQTRAFLQSEAGQAFLNLGSNAVTIDEKQIGSFMKNAGKKGGNANFKPSDFYAVNDDALLSELSQLPEDVQEEILAFLTSPLGEKMIATLEKAETAHMNLAREMSKENGAKIDALVGQVFADYNKGIR